MGIGKKISNAIGSIARFFSVFTSFTNPYSLRLKYFMKEVAPKYPEKLDLLIEYSNYKQLRPEIYLKTGKYGRIEDVIIVDQDEYNNIKKNLKIDE